MPEVTDWDELDAWHCLHKQRKLELTLIFDCARKLLADEKTSRHLYEKFYRDPACVQKNIAVCKNCELRLLQGHSLTAHDGTYSMYCFDRGTVVNKVQLLCLDRPAINTHALLTAWPTACCISRSSLIVLRLSRAIHAFVSGRAILLQVLFVWVGTLLQAGEGTDTWRLDGCYEFAAPEKKVAAFVPCNYSHEQVLGG